MYWLIFCAFLLLNKVYAQNIEDEIAEYFKTEAVSMFEMEWRKQRAPFENAIAFALRENYGLRSLNVYVKHLKDTNRLTNGFLLRDNVVDLLIVDPILREFPHFIMPHVTQSLASNIMTIKANLNKIFVDAHYLLFRNDSALLYGNKQDPYKHSPFTFQQVMNRGQLTIIAEDCVLRGAIITKLCGESVTIGADTIGLSECKFNIEIFSHGVSSPPVLAPYFSDHQKFQLENILIEPICEELHYKVQGAMFSYINTSALFGEDMPGFRFEQETIIEETRNWMTKVIRNLNKITIEKNQGVLPLEHFHIFWNETRNDNPYNLKVSLANIVLHGLDTAYSTNRGGPYQLMGLKIVEDISFSIMQIRGIIYYENGDIQGENDFSTELKDLTVQVQLKIEQIETIKEQGKNLQSSIKIEKITVTSPKATEFSIVEPDRLAASHALISGHLINTVPNAISNYLSKVFIEAIQASKGTTSGKEKYYPQTNETVGQSCANEEVTPKVDATEDPKSMETKTEGKEVEAVPSDDDASIGKIVAIDENSRRKIISSKNNLTKKSLSTKRKIKLKQKVKANFKRSAEGRGQTSRPIKPLKNVTDNEIRPQ